MTRWGYFILYIKKILTEDIVKIYIKKISLKYRLLKKIILDRDLRFITAF